MNGYERIEAERARQIEGEGWRAEGDDHYTEGQLKDAAIAYETGIADMWPWDLKGFKQTTRERDYEKAGALWLAERDRCERAGEPDKALAAQVEASRLGDRLDRKPREELRTSILVESTADKRWAVCINRGPDTTARVFPTLEEAFTASWRKVADLLADKKETPPDTHVQPELPFELDLLDLKATQYVIGPGFEAPASQTENAETQTHE